MTKHDIPHQTEPSKEQAELEDQASRIIAHLKQQEQQADPMIEDVSPIRPIIDDLRAALDYDDDADLEDILEHQARVMNKSFRRLILDADTTYENADRCNAKPAVYACAFKAQDLFRRAAFSLNYLKRFNMPGKNSRNEV